MNNDVKASDEAEKAKKNLLKFPNAMWIWALLVTNMGTYVEANKNAFLFFSIFLTFFAILFDLQKRAEDLDLFMADIDIYFDIHNNYWTNIQLLDTRFVQTGQFLLKNSFSSFPSL